MDSCGVVYDKVLGHPVTAMDNFILRVICQFLEPVNTSAGTKMPETTMVRVSLASREFVYQ